MTIQRSGLGTTSLGAVGGPKGIAAGSVRILLEFFTAYDAKAVKQVKADLESLAQQARKLDAQEASRTRAYSVAQSRVAQAQAIIQTRLSKDERQAFQQSLIQRQTGNRRQLDEARQLAKTSIASAIQSGRITQDQGKLLSRHFIELQRERKLKEDISDIDEKQTQNKRDQVKESRKLQQLEAPRKNIGQRLGGLFAGGVSAVVGGALIGVGFEAMQAGIDAVGQKFLDIVDPARHARDAIHDFGEEILKIRDEGGLTTLEATDKFLKSIGFNLSQAQRSQLAGSATDAGISNVLDRQLQVQEALGHADAVRVENLQKVKQLLLAQDPSRTENLFTVNGMIPNVRTMTDEQLKAARAARDAADAHSLEADAIAYLDNLMKQLEDDAQRAAAAQTALAQEAINAATMERLAGSFYAVQGQNQNQYLTEGFDTRIGTLQRQRAALDKRSAAAGNPRADALQARIDRMQTAHGNQEFARSLGANSEERELMLLKQRLKLQGDNINLDKFSGKFLVAAIDAKIDALNKQAAAQDHVNKLQDIERAASDADKLRRNEGEGIADFIERRAEANQAVLRDQADLRRQDQIDHLNDLKENAEEQVALAQNLEDRRKLIEDKAYQDRLAALQKQLQAAQKLENHSLDKKKELLDQEIAAEEKKKKKVLEVNQSQYLQQLQDAISFAKTSGELSQLLGSIQGLKQAKGYIQALVRAGLITAGEAQGPLTNIDQVLNSFEAKTESFFPTRPSRSGPLGAGGGQDDTLGGTSSGGRAKGGIFTLRNSRATFGQNIRTGEEGTELGVILSHSVVKALRDTQSDSRSVGTVNVYNDRTNPYAEAYRTRRAVEQALRNL